MSIEEVTRAIKNLGNDDVDEDDDNKPSNSQKVIEISDDSDNSNASEDSDVSYVRSKSDKFDNSSRFFCYEDTFFAKDINVEVEGIGELSFPINEKCIQDMIKVSSKAKFGKGQETLLDISVRDTQIIPACKLKVTVNEQSLCEVLERISSGLNIGEDCIIKPHLYNMLIYGPGQFFKKHQDSEKIPHMIATLVIVLPSLHKGGDLIIEHNSYKHAFFGSPNPGIIKCVAFYSDCHHEIKKIIEGYRVALTYNIVMESSVIPSSVAVSKKLDNAVANYFDGSNSKKRLVYLLNHSYSKNNLKWSTLKGTDRTHAHTLFAIAKKQDRMPYLALADCKVTRCDDDWGYGYDEDSDISSHIDLYFWVDEQNLNPDKSNFEVYNTYGWYNSWITEKEISYTTKTAKLFEPYKTRENSYTGNEGASCDYWYKRACVVLFSSKWVFKGGFKFAVNEFYQLTFQEGNEDRLLEEINKAGDNFMNYAFWKDTSIAEMLFKIVVYLNNKEKAILILSEIPQELLVVDKLELFLQLEAQYDFETWNQVLRNWTKNINSWQKIFDNAIPFIEMYKKDESWKETSNDTIPFIKVYKKYEKKKSILNVLISSNWSTLKGYKLALNELYELTAKTGNIECLLKKINKAGNDFMKHTFWKDPSIAEMLFKIVVYLNNKEKAISILSKLPQELLVVDKLELFLQLEAQYDFETWNEILRNWMKDIKSWQKIFDDAIPFIEMYKKDESWKETLDDTIPFIEVHKKYEKKKSILNVLINSNWNTLKGYKLALNELYELTAKTGNIESLLKEINKAGESFFNCVHWSDSVITDMLVKIVIYLNNPEKATSILSQLLTQLLDMSKIEAISTLENQYDVNVWAAIMKKRKILRISNKIFSSEDSKKDIKDLIKFIKKFKSFAPNSILIGFFVTEIIDKYIIKISMKNQSALYKIDNSLVTEFCMLLKTCIKTGHMTGKKTLIDHAVTNYQTLSQADILFKLQEDLDPVDFVEYIEFKDHIIKLIDNQLENIDSNSWEITVDITCSCKYCSMVNTFLKSQTRTKIVVAAAEKIRKHICSNFYRLGNLIKTDTERSGSPYKLIIEKQRKVLSDRQDLIEELIVCKTKLQSIIFTEQLVSVKTEKEDTLSSKIISKDRGEHLANTSIETKGVLHCVKTEHVDSIEHQTNAETPVKKESQKISALKTYIKGEGTSPFRFKSETRGSIEVFANVKTEPLGYIEPQTNVETVKKATGVKKENQEIIQLQTHTKVEGTSPFIIKNESKSSVEIFANVKIEPEDDINDCDNGDSILPSKRQKTSDE